MLPDYFSDNNPCKYRYDALRLLNSTNGFSIYAYYAKHANVSLAFIKGKLTGGATYEVKMRIYVEDFGGDGSIGLIPYSSSGVHINQQLVYFNWRHVEGASQRVYDVVATIKVPSGTDTLSLYYCDQEVFYIGSISVTKK
jgi:hypothetical protein